MIGVASSSATRGVASAADAVQEDEQERKSSSDDLEMPPVSLNFTKLTINEDPPIDIDDDPLPRPHVPPPRPKSKAQGKTVEDWFASESLGPLSAADEAMPVASSHETTASKSFLKPKAKAESTASAASNPIESSADGPPSSHNEPAEPDPKKREFWEKLESAKGRHVGDIPCAVMSLGSNISSCVAKNVSS